MKKLDSCKQCVQQCIDEKYFAVAHLHKEEKTMNMHLHDCLEIYYAIAGGKQFFIDSRVYDIEEGDLFVINQNESHHLTTDNSGILERIVLSIHPAFLQSISTESTDLLSCVKNRTKPFSHKRHLDKEQQNRFLYYIDKITTEKTYGADILEQAYFMELIVWINHIMLSYQEEKMPVYSRQIHDIMTYINHNISEALTIETLSKQFYLSASYISRQFKSCTGMTINRYITARRISIAKSLLADGEHVAFVCEKSGYHDYSNFVRTFTKVVGMSPKKYALISQE